MSHEGEYLLDQSNKPLNPWGRTGLRGRGVLGKWGPNHAADPLVTRWTLDEAGNKRIQQDSGKPILEFVCIQRADSGVWAIPGGMVDPGERIATTLKREFMEEALDSTATARQNIDQLNDVVTDFFEHGEEVSNISSVRSKMLMIFSKIYRGYVDDPRNTDNAWMETVVMHFHDESGQKVNQFVTSPVRN